jgi:hypothetical protein
MIAPLRMIRIIVLSFCLLANAGFASSQPLVINEVMASNATTIGDEDGDFEDWVELYNPGGQVIHLIGYGLSDDYDNPFRWIFPDVAIHPGEFLLVWASGKNRSQPGGPLHTNFAISATGEEVLITRPDGVRLDELPPTPIPIDISFGRQPDGGEHWYFFNEPTPGAPNTGEGFYDILEPPVFSKEGGFYTESFALSISHPEPDVTIVYTLDGSEPSINNIDGTTYFYKNSYPMQPGSPMGDFLTESYQSLLYDGSISVYNRSDTPDKLSQMASTVQVPYYFPQEPVFKAMIVRARAYKEGMMPGDVATHSYFITADGASKFSLPVISVATQEDNLFDYEKGIYTPGIDADQWRLDNPDNPFGWPFPGNYRRRGDEVEYPAHFELFEIPDGSRAVARDVGLRIHGGATRAFPMKSLRIYARNVYGHSHFFYPFFESRPHSLYKRLILRNSGNDFMTNVDPWSVKETMFRDAAIQEIMRPLHVETQAYQPAIVFLNGEYWGIQNIRERYDKHFLERVYGVDPENIDLLTSKDVPQEGDNLHYKATLQYIEEHGLEEVMHYEYIQTRIDVENYIDYNIANIYSDNTDWPGNNIDFWRLRTITYMPNSPFGHDGRWRWLLFDMDFGFGLRSINNYAHNTLAFAAEADGEGWPNPPWSTLLFRNFLENHDFRIQFINRFADLLNTAFLPERTTGVINTFKDDIRDEIVVHLDRWGYPDAYDLWKENVQVMLDFALKRPMHQKEHIRNFFHLDGMIDVHLDVDNQLKGNVRINTIVISPETAGVADYPYPWKGRYFINIPIEIEAIPAPGYEFSHWEGAVASDSAVLAIDVQHDVSLKAHFSRTDDEVLIHYWHFDTAIPNDTPLENLPASYSILSGGAEIQYFSCLEGYPFYPGHAMWRKASMERRNEPTPMNYRPDGNNGIPYANASMRGLQVKQPFVDGDKENTMIFSLPSDGFTDVVFRFAAKDEGAADVLIIDYSLDAHSNVWISEDLDVNELTLESWYKLYVVDFSDIPGANNNPDFKVRIRFDGNDMSEDAGNRVTFNNVSLDGVVIDAFNIYAAADHNGSISPRGRVPVYQFGSQDFLITPNENHMIADVFVDGESISDDLIFMGDTAIYTFSDVRADHHIRGSFSLDTDFIEEQDDNLIIYPNPASYFVSVASPDKINKIEFSDLTGRVVLSHDVLASTGHTVNISHLQNGLYILTVYTENGPKSGKLYVMR